LNEWRLIRDPIYNYVAYNKEIEKKILDTRPMQRLRWLRQLQMSHMVYPGADHTRFQHSLGTMHLAGLFAEKLLSKLEKEQLEGFSQKELVETARIAGLLHDIGHGPFSHAFEEAIFMTRKNLKIRNHEVAGYYITQYSEIGEILDRNGLLDSVLSLLSSEKPSKKILRLIRKTVKEWIYPADILDFLNRDSYYTGTREYGSVDYYRLINLSHPMPSDIEEIVLEERARGALASYLKSRLAMFENVYFHPVSTVFNKMVADIMRLTDDETNVYSNAIDLLAEGDPSKYLELTDYEAIRLGIEHADENQVLQALIQDLLSRRPAWKLIVERKYVIKPSDLSGPATLLLKPETYRSLVESIEQIIYQHLQDKGMEDYSGLWVTLNALKPVPPIPSGYVYFGKNVGGQLIVENKVNIPKLLEEEGILFKLIIRVYAPRKLRETNDLWEKYRKTISKILEKELQPFGLGEVTM